MYSGKGYGVLERVEEDSYMGGEGSELVQERVGEGIVDEVDQ